MRLWFLHAGLAACVAVLAIFTVPASAQVAQTIVIDGVNDFDPANLFDDDTGDTEIKNWCTDDPEDDAPMDLGKIYVTNDVNNIYIGFEYDRDCFASPQVNLGIAFSYGDPADGSTTDPFSRKIAWNSIVNKPDNVFYVVLDAFNYEVLYHWNGASWDNISTSVNPSWGSGSDGLGMANDTGFEELALPLSVFGLAPNDVVNLEIWMTQDGTSKPPLDAMASDDVQTSTPMGTTFDVTTAVEMSTTLPYTIIDAVDNDPPLVNEAVHRENSKIRMTFNEPVDPTTAEVPGNYVLSGGLGSNPAVIGAARDGVATNVVNLTLASDITAAGPAYQVTVTNVEDLSGNAIVNDGVGNVGCFAVKWVIFEGLFGPYLDSHSSPPDGFTVEGSKFPLTFDVCDGADMSLVDAVENIWQFGTDFSFPVSCVDGSGSLVVEWKFNHNCGNWETVGNRQLVLDLDSPGGQTVSHYWDDLDPTQFTDKDIDVIFKVDMNAFGPVPGVDEVALGGSEPPLSFDPPYTIMADDGMGEDEVAEDGIYTVVVTFPQGTLKFVGCKFLLNGSFECPETGNRVLYLDDTLYDTIGGINGPLSLPVAYYNRCYVIGHDVEVVFQVDLSKSNYVNTKADPSVRLTGSVAPLAWDPMGSVQLFDDGVPPDASAGDYIFSASVVFPDSSTELLEFKYAVNGTYESQNQPNRYVGIDDTYDAEGNPQVLPVHDLHHILATDAPGLPSARSAKLLGSWPNPFNPRTTLVYETTRRGRVTLEVFDSRGRRVATLVDQVMDPGRHEVIWDARDRAGRVVTSGVYFARLMAEGSADGHKLILLK